MKESDAFDLTGRVAIVTGAAGGFGRVFCEAMAKHGASVVCADRNTHKLEETAALVSRHGGRCVAVAVDMSRAVQVETMVDRTLADFGRIDILISNAGITTNMVPLHETTLEEWDAMIDTNLKSQFLALKAVLPAMMRQKEGKIITVSSVGALGGNRLAPASYGVSKAGVVALSKYAAVEYGKYGIRVNCILPGVHITDLGMPASEVERAEKVRFLEEMATHAFPLGRVGRPDELEGLAVLLASDASSYITGAIFVQDGGSTAQIP